MKRPPLLTDRQRQLVPFLVAGCTRQEIANDLGIGEDTVRKHVRGILQKFDAVNLRDATIPIAEYHHLYGPDGPRHPFFVLSDQRELVMGGDKLHSGLFAFQKLRIMHDNVHEYVSQLTIEGEVLAHKINGQVLTPIKSQLNTDWFSYQFPETLSYGQQLEIQKITKMKNSFPNAHEFWKVTTPYPSGTIEFRVKFSPKRPATRCWAEGQLRHKTTDIPHPSLSEDGLELTFRVEDPKLDMDYWVHWEW